MNGQHEHDKHSSSHKSLKSMMRVQSCSQRKFQETSEAFDTDETGFDRKRDMKKSTLAMKPKDQSDWGNGNQDLRQTLDKTAQPKRCD